MIHPPLFPRARSKCSGNANSCCGCCRPAGHPDRHVQCWSWESAGVCEEGRLGFLTFLSRMWLSAAVTGTNHSRCEHLSQTGKEREYPPSLAADVLITLGFAASALQSLSFTPKLLNCPSAPLPASPHLVCTSSVAWTVCHTRRPESLLLFLRPALCPYRMGRNDSSQQGVGDHADICNLVFLSLPRPIAVGRRGGNSRNPDSGHCHYHTQPPLKAQRNFVPITTLPSRPRGQTIVCGCCVRVMGMPGVLTHPRGFASLQRPHFLSVRQRLSFFAVTPYSPWVRPLTERPHSTVLWILKAQVSFHRKVNSSFF